MRLDLGKDAMRCPTSCDDDYDAPCHEVHQVRWWRDHEPARCQSDPSAARANALVRAFVLRDFHATWDEVILRRASDGVAHLRACPEAHVLDGDGEDGTYGCTTGCEYWTVDAVITCPHGRRHEHHVGDFGDLEGLIQRLEADA